jgi:hypothetical protein
MINRFTWGTVSLAPKLVTLSGQRFSIHFWPILLEKKRGLTSMVSSR